MGIGVLDLSDCNVQLLPGLLPMVFESNGSLNSKMVDLSFVKVNSRYFILSEAVYAVC